MIRFFDDLLQDTGVIERFCQLKNCPGKDVADRFWEHEVEMHIEHLLFQRAEQRRKLKKRLKH